MALSKVDAVNFLTGTIPQGNVANASLNAVTALPAAIATGKILKAAYGEATASVTANTNSFVDAGITTSITPTATDNHLYVEWNLQDIRRETNVTNMVTKIYRQVNGGGYSALATVCSGLGYGVSTTATFSASGSYKDSTYNSTDQVDYKIYFNSNQNNDKFRVNVDGTSISTIIVMEVDV
jgi:hypothetical protein